MTVKELISRLSGCDPDATVVFDTIQHGMWDIEQVIPAKVYGNGFGYTHHPESDRSVHHVIVIKS